MAHLLDPGGSAAIILGAADWTRADLSRAPSFHRSAAHMHAYLLASPPGGLGLPPDMVLSLFDDPAPASAQLGRISETIRTLVRERREAGRPLGDILIYYVGHGTCEGAGRLHLLVRDSIKGIEEQTSIGTPDLAHVLRVAAPQQRRLVILDCCFSEAAAEAFGAMSALEEAVASNVVQTLAPQPAPPERGTLLLCSSPRRSVSIGKPGAERTLFTGAMLRVLQTGSPSRTAAMLSFADLRDDIWDVMLAEHEGGIPPRPALHQPEQQAGDLTRLPAFPNVAGSQEPTLMQPDAAKTTPRDNLPWRPVPASGASLPWTRRIFAISGGCLAIVLLGSLVWVTSHKIAEQQAGVTPVPKADSPLLSKEPPPLLPTVPSEPPSARGTTPNGEGAESSRFMILFWPGSSAAMGADDFDRAARAYKTIAARNADTRVLITGDNSPTSDKLAMARMSAVYTALISRGVPKDHITLEQNTESRKNGPSTHNTSIDISIQ